MRPRIKKWGATKREEFMRLSVSTQVEVSEDLKVEIIGVEACHCGHQTCSSVKTRFMPMIKSLDQDNGTMEWIATETLHWCDSGAFEELVEALWRNGRHLSGCKCVRCSRSRKRWRELDKARPEVHREWVQAYITKEQHQEYLEAYPDSKVTMILDNPDEVIADPDEDPKWKERNEPAEIYEEGEVETEEDDEEFEPDWDSHEDLVTVQHHG